MPPRSIPRPRKIDGRIGFMPSDGVFLGARDLVGHVPLRIRIVEVVEYPVGTPIGGRPSNVPFPALIYEARAKNGAWVRAKRPLRLNATNHMALFTRFGEQAEWWAGMEVTLDLTPQRNPKGGPPVAGIIIAPETDEQTEEQMEEKLRRALRGECPYQPEAPSRVIEREPGADEDEPEPSDDFPSISSSGQTIPSD